MIYRKIKPRYVQDELQCSCGVKPDRAGVTEDLEIHHSGGCMIENEDVQNVDFMTSCRSPHGHKNYLLNIAKCRQWND